MHQQYHNLSTIVLFAATAQRLTTRIDSYHNASIRVDKISDDGTSEQAN